MEGAQEAKEAEMSAYVLEKVDNDTEPEKAKDKYEARLDEIDRLIISIQGGDSSK